RSIATGHGRETQRRVAVGCVSPANFGGTVDGRLGGGSGRGRLTLQRQHDALAPDALQLHDPIVSGSGVGQQIGDMCGGASEFALMYLCPSETVAAYPRVVPVADGVGEVASFFGGGARRERISGVVRCA